MILTDKETGKKYKVMLGGMQTASNTRQLVVEEILEKKAISFDDVADDVLITWIHKGHSGGDHFLDAGYRKGISNLRFSDKWNPWRGGECPLPEGVMVEIEYRNHPAGLCEARTLDWTRDLADDDIIAYRVACLADGYCYKDDLKAQGFAVPNSFPGLKNNN